MRGREITQEGFESIRDDGVRMLALAREMARRCMDAAKIARKLGSREDLEQQIVLVLLMIRSGEKRFDPSRGIGFEGFVLNEVRILANRNCLEFDSLDDEDTREAADTRHSASSGDDDLAPAFVEEGALLEKLSPRERLLAKCSASGLAKLVGQTDRNIRIARSKIVKMAQENMA